MNIEVIVDIQTKETPSGGRHDQDDDYEGGRNNDIELGKEQKPNYNQNDPSISLSNSLDSTMRLQHNKVKLDIQNKLKITKPKNN